MRKRNKAQETQVLHNKIAHSTLPNAQPIPQQQLAPPGQLPQLVYTSMIFQGMESPSG